MRPLFPATPPLEEIKFGMSEPALPVPRPPKYLSPSPPPRQGCVLCTCALTRSLPGLQGRFVSKGSVGEDEAGGERRRAAGRRKEGEEGCTRHANGAACGRGGIIGFVSVWRRARGRRLLRERGRGTGEGGLQGETGGGGLVARKARGEQVVGINSSEPGIARAAPKPWRRRLGRRRRSAEGVAGRREAGSPGSSSSTTGQGCPRPRGGSPPLPQGARTGRAGGLS